MTNEIIVEFQKQSRRTAPFRAEVVNKQEFDWFLSNYSLGLAGETLELWEVLSKHSKVQTADDFKNTYEEFVKESGDVWHYLVNLLSVLGENFDIEKVYDPEKELIYVVGDFVEMVKKKVYHGHEFGNFLLVSKLYGVAHELIDQSGMNLKEILDTNIDKLKKRYPECFTTKDSIARVDLESK